MSRTSESRTQIPHMDVDTNPFGKNISGEYAYERAERIIHAAYLITNHIRYDEPLRKEFRSLGHKILSDILSARAGFHTASERVLVTTLSDIRNMITLTRLLHVAGYVSAQNTSILITALDELGQFISRSRQSLLADAIQLQRTDMVPARVSEPSGQKEKPAGKTRVKRPQKRRTQGKVSLGRTPQTHLHAERRSLILDILRRSGPLGIKDITSQVTGCSEKTVQRELAALVLRGEIQKKGEKRWSNYSIVVQ